MTLEETLISEHKTRWLDVGCGSSVAESFEGADVFPANQVREQDRDRYHQLDIVHASEQEIKALGTFDLVRSQHMLEHVTFEEAVKVFENCAKLLKPDGYMVCTVPDLRAYIQMYLNDEFKDWPEYVNTYARVRIPEGAPNSAYFSYYSHATANDPHKWCYDYEGLEFQVKRSGMYKNFQELKSTDALASNPFTHSRPREDVCVVAQKA